MPGDKHVPDTKLAIPASIGGASSTPTSERHPGLDGHLITHKALMDTVASVDPSLLLEDEVKVLLLEYMDDFVDDVVHTACKLAVNRGERAMEVKDVQMALNRNYDTWVPGFGTEGVKPHRRHQSEAHKQRMGLIRKTLRKF